MKVKFASEFASRNEVKTKANFDIRKNSLQDTDIYIKPTDLYIKPY